MRFDKSLDCFGLLCPMPVIKTAEMMKSMKVGEILEISATDEGIKLDMPAWCKATGNEFMGVVEEKGEFKAYVRKLAV